MDMYLSVTAARLAQFISSGLVCMLKMQSLKRQISRYQQATRDGIRSFKSEVEPGLAKFARNAAVFGVAVNLLAILVYPPITILLLLFGCLIISTILINWYAYGWSDAKWRVLFTAFMGGAAGLPSMLLAQWNMSLGLFLHLGLWVIAAIYGLLWPTYVLALRRTERPYLHLPALLLLLLMAGVGSTYIPMRSVVNEVPLRSNNEAIQSEILSNAEIYGIESANLMFQTKYLYDIVPKEATKCSRVLRSSLRPILNPEEISLHATAAFWIDEFLKSIWGVQSVFGCSVSDYQAKRNSSANTLATHAYSAFLTFLWVPFLCGTLWKLSQVWNIRKQYSR